jgi:hypothetical protein
MALFENVDGEPQEIKIHGNDGGDPVPYNLYVNDGGEAVPISTHETGPPLGETISFWETNNTDTTSNESGYFAADGCTEDCDGLRVTLADGIEGHTRAVSRTGSGDTLSDHKDISDLDAGDTFDLYFDETRSAGSSISIQIDGGGSEYTRARIEGSDQFPYESEHMTVTAGVFSAGMSLSSNNGYNVAELTPILAD